MSCDGDFVIHFVFSHRELLAGSLARLGSDINALCPQLKDREDEDELAKHFHFVLATESPDGTMAHIRPLDNADKLVHFFKCQESTNCLLLSLKSETTAASAEARTTSTEAVDTETGTCVFVSIELILLKRT